MAEEPSAKHHHAETSDKSSNLLDIHVPGEKREYTTTLTGVELHSNETLEIVCTSVPEKTDEINPNKFISIQHKWRVPYTGKEYDSLTDVASSVIHPFYKGMKKKINMQEDYKLWGTSPLPDNLIEYAGVDAYATYKSWFIIDYITYGSEYAKEREGDHY
ncbi:hypothetical protein VPH35_028770 [Triticum aestivum]